MVMCAIDGSQPCELGAKLVKIGQAELLDRRPCVSYPTSIELHWEKIKDKCLSKRGRLMLRVVLDLAVQEVLDVEFEHLREFGMTYKHARSAATELSGLLLVIDRSPDDLDDDGPEPCDGGASATERPLVVTLTPLGDLVAGAGNEVKGRNGRLQLRSLASGVRTRLQELRENAEVRLKWLMMEELKEDIAQIEEVVSRLADVGDRLKPPGSMAGVEGRAKEGPEGDDARSGGPLPCPGA